MKRLYKILFIAAFTLSLCACSSQQQDFRLLYWNIQNGMWDGQGDNYDRFVEFVKEQNPDICVWCEAKSLWTTDSDTPIAEEDQLLPDAWGELAARYGHAYWGIGGYRDGYPQVITSKYPITYVDKITGDPDDVIVSHGAGWATVEVGGKTINVVTLHTWPQKYAYMAEDREASIAENGGDKFRAREMQYICQHTIEKCPNAANEYWMMMGDFNSISIVDNDKYELPEDSPKFLVHNYVRANTPYIDVIRQWHGKYIPSIHEGKTQRRIDFVYCTQPLYDCITSAEIVWNDYTTPVKTELSNFYRPSDHLPIVVDFKL